MRTLRRIAVVVFLTTAIQMAHGQCGKVLSPFLNDPEPKRLRNIADLHKNGKEAIPRLLEQLGDTHDVRMLMDPYYSQLPPRPLLVSFCGEVAAYLIELILGRSELSLEPSGDSFLGGGSFLGSGPPRAYVYPVGVIVDVRTGKAVNSSELERVKSVYIKWWKSNAKKSIEELRKDWAQGQKPLSGSGFAWFASAGFGELRYFKSVPDTIAHLKGNRDGFDRAVLLFEQLGLDELDTGTANQLGLETARELAQLATKLQITRIETAPRTGSSKNEQYIIVELKGYPAYGFIFVPESHTRALSSVMTEVSAPRERSVRDLGARWFFYMYHMNTFGVGPAK